MADEYEVEEIDWDAMKAPFISNPKFKETPQYVPWKGKFKPGQTYWNHSIYGTDGIGTGQGAAHVSGAPKASTVFDEGLRVKLTRPSQGITPKAGFHETAVPYKITQEMIDRWGHQNLMRRIGMPHALFQDTLPMEHVFSRRASGRPLDWQGQGKLTYRPSRVHGYSGRSIGAVKSGQVRGLPDGPFKTAPTAGSVILRGNHLALGENTPFKRAGQHWQKLARDYTPFAGSDTTSYGGRHHLGTGSAGSTGKLSPSVNEAFFPAGSSQPMTRPSMMQRAAPAFKGFGLGLGTMITLPNTQIEPSGDPGYRKQVPQKPTKWYHHIFGAPRKEVFVDQFGNPLEG